MKRIPELSFGHMKPDIGSYECKLRLVWDNEDGGVNIGAPSSRWMACCMLTHKCTELEALSMLAAKWVEQGILPASLLRKGNRPKVAVSH